MKYYNAPFIGLFIIMVVMIMTPDISLAWGRIGHRVVAKIAMNNLTDTTRNKIIEILGNDRLDFIASVPDTYRNDKEVKFEWIDAQYDYEKNKLVYKDTISDYGKLRRWHGLNIYEYNDYYSMPDGIKKINAYTGMHNVMMILQNNNDLLKRENKERYIEILKVSLGWITHVIGDLHQPLHVGRSSDWGGGHIDINTYFGKMTLHQLWDDGLIDEERLSAAELMDLIVHQYPNHEQNKYESGCLMDWILESRDLATLAYDYDTDEKSGLLSSSYLNKSLEIIKKQLLKAGYRLAYMLNSALDHGQMKCEINSEYNKFIHNSKKN